jgi:methylated-DNA-[protein]-cysteine S-methyltransferase
MIIHAPIGELRVFVDDTSVVEVLLPGWRSDLSPSSRQDTNYAREVESAFYGYFSAESKKQVKHAHAKLVETCLTNGEVDGVSPFHKSIYAALVKDVPTGTTATYGELAELAGKPLAARAVGTAMRKNPLPIIVPCHRIVQANGGLGGYIGSGEDGLRMKKFLLAHEGAMSK